MGKGGKESMNKKVEYDSLHPIVVTYIYKQLQESKNN